ncbi:hypothetical protein [Microbacterium sp. GXF7504]
MILATLLASEEAEHGNIALETIGFPIVAAIVFVFLGLVALSYRNVANRHAHKAEVYAQRHAKDLQHSGHGH